MYLKSVLISNFLILDSCHPDTIDMSKDVTFVVFFQTQKESASKKDWETLALGVGSQVVTVKPGVQSWLTKSWQMK